jgi:hypothetical protein
LVVAVIFYEVVRAVLFACGGTSIHPFVSYACLPAVVQATWAWHRIFFATVSRTPAVSIKVTLGNKAGSIGSFRLALAPARVPASEEEGADATALLQCMSSSFVRGFSQTRRTLIMVVPGEAESGSAGTQPDEE